MTTSDRFQDVLARPDVTTRQLEDDGTFPNNKTLPLVVYRRAFDFPGQDPAGTLEDVFEAHRWGGSWRNGIYDYHHYHSTAHEVLGIARGSAHVQLGGPDGATFEVEAGDVIILPAGVAHKNLGSSSDFVVVGAYPEGQRWDMNYGKDDERPAADRNIEEVPLPASDPVYGPDGPLVKHWNA